jgi:ribosome recycling factor
MQALINDVSEKMDKSVSALRNAFNKIRTGRANPSILEQIEVDYYGTNTPINQMSNISIEDARTLTIVPWEKDQVQNIEKAIQSSDIGLQPATSGDVIRVIIPELTEETRRDLIKIAKSEAENSKIAIRNQRRDANAILKEFCNEKEISQDELRRGEEIIQNITNEFIDKIEKLLEKKEKDLLEI